MNIIITGASKGIGKAIAEKYAEQGNTLLLCARNETHLFDLKDRIMARNKSAEVKYFSADLGRMGDVLDFSKWILCQTTDIDILVNNAGQFVPGSVYNEREGHLEKMIGVNLYSAYYLTRALLPAMMERRSGHIFNMCSIASLQAYANGGAYSISKFALMGFSKNLREEMKSFNIKVTSVYPGAVLTASWEGAGVDPKRIMEAEDIAQLVYAAGSLSPQACVEDIVVRPQKGDLSF